MEVSGARILFTIPVLGGIKVSETIVNSWIVIAFLFLLIKIFTHHIEKVPKAKQALAEKFVTMMYGMTETNVGKNGKHFDSFVAYIGTLLLFSMCNSLSGLTGLRPATADITTTLGWAAVTFIIITVVKIKTNRVSGYLKGFLQPIFVLLPINIIGEIAVPVSMALRHFCNILIGCVFGSLIGGFLEFLSGLVLGAFGVCVPMFKIGVPAVLSLYFDLFGSFIQAYVFITLTLAFVGQAKETN